MATENLSKINTQLKRELTKKNKEIESLKRNDEARFLEWQTQKNKAKEAEQKANSLQKEVEKLNDELEDKDIDYKRLVGITQSLSRALYSASDALFTMAGRIHG